MFNEVMVRVAWYYGIKKELRVLIFWGLPRKFVIVKLPLGTTKCTSYKYFHVPVHPSITFLVNVSPPKILDIPTSIFGAAFMQMQILRYRWALQLIFCRCIDHTM